VKIKFASLTNFFESIPVNYTVISSHSSWKAYYTFNRVVNSLFNEMQFMQQAAVKANTLDSKAGWVSPLIKYSPTNSKLKVFFFVLSTLFLYAESGKILQRSRLNRSSKLPLCLKFRPLISDLDLLGNGWLMNGVVYVSLDFQKR
jgi:hypothetical protein